MRKRACGSPGSVSWAGKSSLTMNADEEKLIERLRSIERLFAGATTPGERTAAAGAMDRVRQRLAELKETDPEAEYKFTLGDGWSRRLFVALLRRHGINPYRYRGQRRTTVMVRVPRRFVDETLWPEFEKLSATLRAFLDDITERVIRESVFSDDSEPEEVADPEILHFLDSSQLITGCGVSGMADRGGAGDRGGGGREQWQWAVRRDGGAGG